MYMYIIFLHRIRTASPPIKSRSNDLLRDCGDDGVEVEDDHRAEDDNENAVGDPGLKKASAKIGYMLGNNQVYNLSHRLWLR